jgi:hypothetical protein
MWNGLFFDTGQSYRYWDDQPGGTIRERYTDDEGQEYVLVEFDNSPGLLYVYYA